MISSEKKKGFSGALVGFVLEVNPENVVATGSEDLFAAFYPSEDEDFDKRLVWFSSFPKCDIRPPADIIDKTVLHQWNEIVLTGTDKISGKQVKPVAVVLNCTVERTTAIHELDEAAFRGFVKEHCPYLVDSVIQALQILKGRYPIYSFEFDRSKG